MFSFFSVKREMPILFFVNRERTVLFSVKRDLDPPPPIPPSIERRSVTSCYHGSKIFGSQQKRA